MKTFDKRFVGGSILNGVGSFGVMAGILAFTPPTSNVALGTVLIAICLPMVILGYRLTVFRFPKASKIEVETLRKAGLVDDESGKK